MFHLLMGAPSLARHGPHITPQGSPRRGCDQCNVTMAERERDQLAGVADRSPYVSCSHGLRHLPAAHLPSLGAHPPRQLPSTVNKVDQCSSKYPDDLGRAPVVRTCCRSLCNRARRTSSDIWQAAKSATVALKGRPRDFSTAPMNSRGASHKPQPALQSRLEKVLPILDRLSAVPVREPRYACKPGLTTH